MKLRTFQKIATKNPLKAPLSYYTLVSESDAQILLSKPSKDQVENILAKYGNPEDSTKVPDNTKGQGQTKKQDE
jgi:hypothetical protein